MNEWEAVPPSSLACLPIPSPNGFSLRGLGITCTCCQQKIKSGFAFRSDIEMSRKPCGNDGGKTLPAGMLLQSVLTKHNSSSSSDYLQLTQPG